MNNWCVRSAMNVLGIVAAVAALTLVSATSLRAQISPTASGAGLSGRDRDINQREAEMSSLERQGKAGPKRDPQMILAEVNEDFDRLRAIDEEMKTSLKSQDALDYKHIVESSAEVKKRAMRLKTNLALPAPKDMKREKMQDPGADLKPSLVMLESLINSFITNPIFSDSGGLDAKLAGKAKLDLESIIELSDKVRKSAEKISKNARKP
ncbi:MAG TPA: hypothetical protein VM911_22565 [Pyrinomonadaceae bacterium]|nr:hypothetical protein [Pyrinomonadaceae bacterium]